MRIHALAHRPLVLGAAINAARRSLSRTALLPGSGIPRRDLPSLVHAWVGARYSFEANTTNAAAACVSATSRQSCKRNPRPERTEMMQKKVGPAALLPLHGESRGESRLAVRVAHGVRVDAKPWGRLPAGQATARAGSLWHPCSAFLGSSFRHRFYETLTKRGQTPSSHHGV
jgi:hypothetical protein